MGPASCCAVSIVKKSRDHSDSLLIYFVDILNPQISHLCVSALVCHSSR